MAGGDDLADRLHDDRSRRAFPRYEGLGVLVAVAVREVEQASGDKRGLAVLGDIAKADGHEGSRAIGGEDEVDDRMAEDLDRL